MAPQLQTGSILNPGAEMTALRLLQAGTKRQTEIAGRVQRLLPTPPSRLPVSEPPCLSSWVLFSYSWWPPAPAVETEDAKTSQAQKR